MTAAAVQDLIDLLFADPRAMRDQTERRIREITRYIDDAVALTAR